MMAWLITAKIIVVFLVLALLVPELQAAYHTATYTGTCASIGYSTKCCPPGLDCTAKDGNCTCDTSCHNHKNLCCKDVFCRQSKLIIIVQCNNYYCALHVHAC